MSRTRVKLGSFGKNIMGKSTEWCYLFASTFYIGSTLDSTVLYHYDINTGYRS